MTRIRPKRWAIVLLVCGCLLSLIAYDYVTYHSRYRSAIDVAHSHGARVGSLLDWPFGRECRITFDRPVDRDAIPDLAVLTSLASRHSVGIAFNYDMADADLKHARDTLRECHVFRVGATDRQP